MNDLRGLNSLVDRPSLPLFVDKNGTCRDHQRQEGRQGEDFSRRHALEEGARKVSACDSPRGRASPAQRLEPAGNGLRVRIPRLKRVLNRVC